MRIIALLLFWTAIASGQDLFAWVDLDNQIVFQPREAELLVAAWEIQSEGGHLVAPSRPAPFSYMLSTTSEQLTAGNLGGHVTVRRSGLAWGEYDLSAALEAGIDPCSDVMVFIGNGPRAPSFPLVPTDALPQPEPPTTSFCATPGDVNFDGDVTFSDFLTLSENFGMDNAVWTDGDFDWDRSVNFTDFLALVDNYVQPTETASAVPEPGAGLLALTVIAFACSIKGWRQSRGGSRTVEDEPRTT